VHQTSAAHLKTQPDAALLGHHHSHLQEAVALEELDRKLSKSQLMELSKTAKLYSKLFQNAKNKIMILKK